MKLDGKQLTGLSRKASKSVSIKDKDIEIDEKRGVIISYDDASVTVTCKASVAKRYLKYLTRRYLAHIDMRDFLRVTAADKKTYIVKQRRTVDDKDDEEEEAEA